MSRNNNNHTNLNTNLYASDADEILSLNTQETDQLSTSEYQDNFVDTSENGDYDGESDDLQSDNFSENNPEENNIDNNCACSYCGLNLTTCAVKCQVCDKWFCNSRSQTPGSHIIYHLARSKHKEVSLHSTNPLGDDTLECYICGCKNVFLLGFVSSKNSDVAVLLCREPCLQDPSLEAEWKVNEWASLIKERSLLDWLVNTPTNAELLHSKKVNINQINTLEDLWKQNPNAIIEYSPESDDEDEIQEIQSNYKDENDYWRTMQPLVNIEEEYDKKMKEGQIKKNVELTWKSSNGKTTASFYFARDDNDFKLAPGDELNVSLPKNNSDENFWKEIGMISRMYNEEIIITFGEFSNCPTNVNKGFTIDVVWKGTSYTRMKYALNEFKKKKMSNYLKKKILGHDIKEEAIQVKNFPKKLTAPNIPELNYSQLDAVKSALLKPLSLIQGPPGTGKTVTSTAIVYQFSKMNQGQILVCAPSNIAVDQLAERISQTGLEVVRIYARSRESLDSTSSKFALHIKIRNISASDSKSEQFLELLKKKENNGDLSIDEEKKFLKLKSIIENSILKNANVICTTCVGAYDKALYHFKFPYVLIDESTQAMEPECLIPLVKGAKQVVLVGDHCQLGPVVLNKKAAKAGLNRSLFDRLVSLGTQPKRLLVQYRMHPYLSEFPSNTFYDGTLQNGVSESDRLIGKVGFQWPSPQRPMFFYNSSGDEEISVSGTSYLNRAEAIMVEAIVTLLFKNGFSPKQIGVITPYEGQRRYIVSYMQRVGSSGSEMYNEIEVASVDSFQGREKDFIILSCVRSNEKIGIGFLNDPRRLNVALTRAKSGLIVIGNAKILSSQPLWNDLLIHFKKKKCVVEGPLGNLKQSKLTFTNTKKFHNSRYAIGYGQITNGNNINSPRSQ